MSYYWNIQCSEYVASAFSVLTKTWSKSTLTVLAGFEQSHLHVEFHQKVIEPWVGVESEHIARRRLVFHVFMGEFLYGTSDCVARRYPDFRWFPQVALASVDIFHAVTAAEEHVRHGWHYLVQLVAVVGGAADIKSAVDDFVKWKRIKSPACVINSFERSDFSDFMFTLPYVRYSLFEFLTAVRYLKLADL